jgi:hypothetical protein
MKRKPLMTFVKEECANYVRDNCMGLTVENKKFRDYGNCWLEKGEEQKPCPVPILEMLFFRLLDNKKFLMKFIIITKILICLFKNIN